MKQFQTLAKKESHKLLFKTHKIESKRVHVKDRKHRQNKDHVCAVSMCWSCHMSPLGVTVKPRPLCLT